MEGFTAGYLLRSGTWIYHGLNWGERLRFQLAFPLSHDAKLFLMDEPVAGLDPLFRKELLHYMQEIVEDGSRCWRNSCTFSKKGDTSNDENYFG